MELARKAEADIYSSEQFGAATAALKGAETEVTGQEREPWFSRDYDRASALLRRAESLANEAAVAAKANKQKARRAAASAEADARRAIESASRALTRGHPRAGRSSSSFPGDLEAAQESFQEARSALRQARFLDALNQFLAAREKAEAIQSDLKQRYRERR